MSNNWSIYLNELIEAHDKILQKASADDTMSAEDFRHLLLEVHYDIMSWM